MNTLSQGNPPILPETRARDYVILLEDLEFCMPKQQLEKITNLHNSGTDIEDIAMKVKRNPYEVLLAIIHQVKRGIKMRPLAFKKQQESTLMVPGYEQLGDDRCGSHLKSADTAKAV